MKKINLIYLLIFILCLTGCSSHKHEANTFELDKNMHWQFCSDCGEKFNASNHILDEFGFCEVCGASIINNEDGTYMITIYDEYSSIIKQTDYDENDNVITILTCELEYFDDGNVKSEKTYYDDVLTSETFYAKSEKNLISEIYEQMDILYESDGRKFVSIYNEHSMLEKYTEYDSSGNVNIEDVYEYIYDEQGNLEKQTCYSDNNLSSIIEYRADNNGDVNSFHEVYYDKDGNIISEYYYDGEGNIVSEVHYD